MREAEASENMDFLRSFFVSKTERSNGSSYTIEPVRSMEKSDNVREYWAYHIYWAILDVLLCILIIVGNVATILAVRLTRSLRQVMSNIFILNLAISDLLVGLMLPYHLAFYMDSRLGDHEITCVTRFVTMCLACSSSMYSLMAIAVDRYIAVVYPLRYPRQVTRTTVLLVIFFGWFHATALSTVPIYWNNYKEAVECEFENVLPRYYTVGIVCPLICLIWLSMFFLYWRIWRAATRNIRRLKEAGYDNASLNDCKGAKVALSILGCFSICWLPYLILTCTRLFHFNPRGDLYKALFSLAMANSGMNPIIYAWKNKQFRKAFQKLLRLKGPDRKAFSTSVSDNLQKHKELTKPEISVSIFSSLEYGK